MKVSADAELVNSLPPSETLDRKQVVVEKIDRIQTKSGDINFREVLVETIIPYGTGISV